MTAQDEAKKAAGRKVIEEFVRDGMKLGLGSGTTSHFFVRELGRHVADGLKLTCTTTSPRVVSNFTRNESGAWPTSLIGGTGLLHDATAAAATPNVAAAMTSVRANIVGRLRVARLAFMEPTGVPA